MKLICINHPKYDTKTPPDLSCRFCCYMFVNNIRLQQFKLFPGLLEARHENSTNK